METREYDQLQPTDTIHDADKIAFAQNGKPELVTASVGQLVQKVAADVTGGAEAERAAQESAGKQLLAQTLRDKGADVANNATYVQINNALRKLDVAGAKEYWITDFMECRSLDVGGIRMFSPILGSNYILSMNANKLIAVDDMTGQQAFPSMRRLTHDASASTLGERRMGLAVSTDRTKIAYLKNDTTLVVLTVNYEIWTISAAEYTIPSMTCYSDFFATINNEGTTYLNYTGYRTWTAVQVKTGAVLTISGKADEYATMSGCTDWCAWQDEKTALVPKYDDPNLMKITVDFDANRASWENSDVYTGWKIASSYFVPVHYYPEKHLFYRTNYKAYDVSYGVKDNPIYLYFLKTNRSVEFKIRFRSWNGTYITSAQMSDIFIREKDADTLLIQAGDLGRVEYKISTNTIIGKPVPGETNVYEGTAAGANDSGGPAADIYNVYVSSDGALALGTIYANMISFNYLGVAHRSFQNKIAGYYLFRNNKYTLLKYDILRRAMIESGACDVKDTVLLVEEGGLER